MTDIERANELLRAGGHAVVACCGDKALTSDGRGVAPLVDWLAAGVDLVGFSAADRVVGRAAALLYLALGVVRVHALLASAPAAAVFADHGIEFSAETTVPAILNRDRSAGCPMEATVAGVDDPQEAVRLLTAKLAAMRARMGV